MPRTLLYGIQHVVAMVAPRVDHGVGAFSPPKLKKGYIVAIILPDREQLLTLAEDIRTGVRDSICVCGRWLRTLAMLASLFGQWEVVRR